jgi:thiol-disulfide isomerase/thioredoxin
MKKILTTLALACCINAANAQYENTAIKLGMNAPEIECANPEGKMIKLSDVNKGRYVLLDFWASWCRPCRAANPGLVKMYKDYHDKKFRGAKNGFTVVSVSMDANKVAWVNAIKQDGLDWPYHISDLKNGNEPGGAQSAAKYGIQFIPQAFLIDPQGKIIGKYMTAESAENDLSRAVMQ